MIEVSNASANICISLDVATKTAKIGFTGEKERILQVSWSSPNPASIYLFRDLMMEFVDLMSSQNMLKLQTKPIPAQTVPIELKDFLEEDPKPVVDLTNAVDAMKVLRAATPSETQGLSADKKAMADHVLFEEDDESGSGQFRVVCRLNRDAKVVYVISVLNNVANGLDCTSFSIQKTNTSATVKVVLRSGIVIDLTMTVGLNEEKQRVLHGTYPEAQASYGRNFWIRFAETLAAQGLLLGQALAVPTPTTTNSSSSSTSTVSPRSAAAVAASTATTSSALPQKAASASAPAASAAPSAPATLNATVQKENQAQVAEEELGDDSGLEYDSDNYDSSEGSVDSDTD